MRKTMVLVVLVLLGAVRAPAAAQQAQGDLELQFTGSILSTVGQDGGSITSGVFKTKAGYFVSDRVELGVFPSLLVTRIEVDDDWPGAPESVTDTRFGLGAFGTYSFLAADATTVPYVGVQYYRIDVTDGDEAGWVGANGGVKLYLTRTKAFDLGGNVLAGLGDRGGLLILFQAGLSFLL